MKRWKQWTGAGAAAAVFALAVAGCGHRTPAVGPRVAAPQAPAPAPTGGTLTAPPPYVVVDQLPPKPITVLARRKKLRLAGDVHHRYLVDGYQATYRVVRDAGGHLYPAYEDPETHRLSRYYYDGERDSYYWVDREPDGRYCRHYRGDEPDLCYVDDRNYDNYVPAPVDEPVIYGPDLDGPEVAWVDTLPLLTAAYVVLAPPVYYSPGYVVPVYRDWWVSDWGWENRYDWARERDWYRRRDWDRRHWEYAEASASFRLAVWNARASRWNGFRSRDHRAQLAWERDRAEASAVERVGHRLRAERAFVDARRQRNVGAERIARANLMRERQQETVALAAARQQSARFRPVVQAERRDAHRRFQAAAHTFAVRGQAQRQRVAGEQQEFRRQQARNQQLRNQQVRRQEANRAAAFQRGQAERQRILAQRTHQGRATQAQHQARVWQAAQNRQFQANARNRQITQQRHPRAGQQRAQAAVSARQRQAPAAITRQTAENRFRHGQNAPQAQRGRLQAQQHAQRQAMRQRREVEAQTFQRRRAGQDEARRQVQRFRGQPERNDRGDRFGQNRPQGQPSERQRPERVDRGSFGHRNQWPDAQGRPEMRRERRPDSQPRVERQQPEMPRQQPEMRHQRESRPDNQPRFQRQPEVQRQPRFDAQPRMQRQQRENHPQRSEQPRMQRQPEVTRPQ